MTKQEQVKEILEVIKHCGDYTKRDCAECDYRLYGECKNQKQCEAEALYGAGYRKIKEKDETLEEQIKHLNTIVERLDELLGKGINDYIMGIDGVEGLKDMWERSAVREFAEKVKEYINDNADFVYKSECGEYAEINITLCEKYINELLREYE